MASRGSKKWYSVKHEEFVADKYDGKRSPSSGASDSDSGDVRTSTELVECKMTGHPGKEPKRKASMVRLMEKIADEAWEEGKSPVLAYRYFDPNSPLSDRDGWVDLVVRRLGDDLGH
jgi:hypothetical protein